VSADQADEIESSMSNHTIVKWFTDPLISAQSAESAFTVFPVVVVCDVKPPATAGGTDRIPTANAGGTDKI